MKKNLKWFRERSERFTMGRGKSERSVTLINTAIDILLELELGDDEVPVRAYQKLPDGAM
jgi:hypothetical protein